jgi:hypothetical protein
VNGLGFRVYGNGLGFRVYENGIGFSILVSIYDLYSYSLVLICTC